VSERIDIRGLNKFVKGIKAGSQSTGSGPVNNMLKAWGARYLTFIRRRFAKFSRGGGDWKPLAESTKKARRGSKRRKTRSSRAKTKTTTRGSGKKFAILRDTGILLKALSIGAPGNLFKRVKGGIQVGFGGSAKHKGKIKKLSRQAKRKSIRKSAKGSKSRAGLAKSLRSSRAKQGAMAKIADIAAYHNTGGGNLPKREILVQPDARTIRAMKAAAVKYVGKLGRDSSI